MNAVAMTVEMYIRDADDGPFEFVDRGSLFVAPAQSECVTVNGRHGFVLFRDWVLMPGEAPTCRVYLRALERAPARVVASEGSHGP